MENGNYQNRINVMDICHSLITICRSSSRIILAGIDYTTLACFLNLLRSCFIRKITTKIKYTRHDLTESSTVASHFLQGEILGFFSCKQSPISIYQSSNCKRTNLFNSSHRIRHDVGHHKESFVNCVYLCKRTTSEGN